MVTRTKKTPLAGKSSADLPAAFAGLRAILLPYAAKLHVREGSKRSYYLETHLAGPRDKPRSFAAAIIMKNYVSFHLVAVYCFPELLQGMSPALKKRMQGKGCFNFTAPDANLFRELAQLTAAGARKFRSQKKP
jgi:hypothetical protein